jgi:hypothetical protein
MPVRRVRVFKDAMTTNMFNDATMENIRSIWRRTCVIVVTQTMLPLLREAPAARIVNMGRGSLTWNSPRYAPRVYELFGFEIGGTCRVACFCIRPQRAKDQGQQPLARHTATALNNSGQELKMAR